MELRTASSPRDVKTYDTKRLREEFLIDDLFKADDVKLVYSHIDRIITGSAVPVKAPLSLATGDELRGACFWGNPGEDSFGFFALPAGYRFANGSFQQFGRRARFWCKDEYGKSNAYRLSITNKAFDIEGVYRSDAMSVRCVKNA